MKKLPNPAPLTLERRRFSYQAGLLAYASSIPPPSRKYMQWSVRRCLHIYSDRFAQDFHLIPFSPFAAVKPKGDLIRLCSYPTITK